MVLRTSRMRWFGHVERNTGWIAEVRKLNVVAQKRSGRPRKSWDEVLENDRKKVWILLTLKIVLRGEDAYEKDMSKSPTLGRGKQGSKMNMTMMMIVGVIFMKFCLFSFSGCAHGRPLNRALDTYIVFTCSPSKNRCLVKSLFPVTTS